MYIWFHYQSHNHSVPIYSLRSKVNFKWRLKWLSNSMVSTFNKSLTISIMVSNLSSFLSSGTLGAESSVFVHQSVFAGIFIIKTNFNLLSANSAGKKCSQCQCLASNCALRIFCVWWLIERWILSSLSSGRLGWMRCAVSNIHDLSSIHCWLIFILRIKASILFHTHSSLVVALFAADDFSLSHALLQDPDGRIINNKYHTPSHLSLSVLLIRAPKKHTRRLCL